MGLVENQAASVVWRASRRDKRSKAVKQAFRHEPILVDGVRGMTASEVAEKSLRVQGKGGQQRSRAYTWRANGVDGSALDPT